MAISEGSLFKKVEALHGDLPWGDFLDAGTGTSSLNWLVTLPTTSWTAITGAQSMLESCQKAVGDRLRPQDRLIIGNWMNPELLAEESFDTVLADYLIGAMDGFAPYWQDRILPRLRTIVKKRLYIIGLEPYVNTFPQAPEGKIICEIGRLRDACLLLAAERPYREYPADWVMRHLRQAGFRIVEVEKYPIRYDDRFINSQLNMCEARMKRIADRHLASAMLEHVNELRQRALLMSEAQHGLRFGSDYIIAAEPV